MSALEKIQPLDGLSSICDGLRRDGRVVVLAHGTFDLLHLGHVRHLQEAKSHGDVLVVTVTADRYVNKGPGRPVFNELLRAEMLAALGFVDHVAINPALTSEPVIHALKPSVYVKGQDYADAQQDVTGKIVDERLAVEQHGGRIAFTNDITFSSSELINRHLEVFTPEVREHLDRVRQEPGLDALVRLIDAVSDLKVLVIGDTIIDEYHYVSHAGQPSKENIIATRHEQSELFAGGVIAAANHVAGFCRQVDVITCLGDGNNYEDIVRQNLSDNVSVAPIYRPGTPTPRKSRYVDTSYLRKLFEVQFMNDAPLADDLRSRLNARIREAASGYDLVMVADFGHGLITGDTVDVICGAAPFLAVNAQTNSANRGYNLITKYPSADFICIDAPEARLAVGDRFSDLLQIASEGLPGRIDCPKIILTHGRYGCVTYEQGTAGSRIPAMTQTVVDTMGAGDAFFAVTSLLARGGGRMPDVGFIGNIVGALKVGIVGHRQAVDKVSVIKALTTALK